ncbi:MAG: hypothetical protein ACOC22_00660 [bacterium]
MKVNITEGVYLIIEKDEVSAEEFESISKTLKPIINMKREMSTEQKELKQVKKRGRQSNFSEEFKKEVLEFHSQHGMPATLYKYGHLLGKSGDKNIYNWKKTYNI